MEARQPDAQIEYEDIMCLSPSPENEEVYGRVKPDADLLRLAEDIRKRGILQPLEVTLDGYIVSGHRRYEAAWLADLDRVPVIRTDFRRADDPDEYYRRLTAHNLQRVKTIDMKLAEQLVDMSGEDVHARFRRHRREALESTDLSAFSIKGKARRAEISAAKAEMVAAVKKVVGDRTYGRSVWELEALEPDVLQAELDSAIRSVIDVTLFNKELEQEEKDQKEQSRDRCHVRRCATAASPPCGAGVPLGRSSVSLPQ